MTRLMRRGFIERTLDALLAALERAASAETTAAHVGLLQHLDPRVKLVGVLSLVAAVALSRRATVIVAIFGLAVLLAVLSRLPFATLVSGVWLGTLTFTAALALPALVLTPGRPVARVPVAGWPITAQGLTAAGFLLLRVETTATLGFLLVFTTRWTHVMKALRAFRVPVVFVVAMGMTYRYILLLLETAHGMFEARRSRMAGALTGPERRRLTAQGAGVLLGKTLQLGGDVYLAMQARGFRGDVYVLDDFRMTRVDWLALASLAGAAAIAVWAGR